MVRIWHFGAVAAGAAACVAAAGLTAGPAGAADETTIVAAGSGWRYHDAGTDLGTDWRSRAYDDAGWQQGQGQLGYGDGDETTVVAPGRITYYFRRGFDVADPGAVQSLRLRALVDDGAVVYLNGTEVWRTNVAAGQTATTEAAEYLVGAPERSWQDVELPTAPLVAGENVLAVEVHNYARSSTDVSFDAELTASLAAAVPQPAPEAQAGPAVLCRIDNANLREISGLASSVNFPGVVWAHNDSGDSARIFAVDTSTCAIRATVTLAGVNAQDFESISVGRDPSGRPVIWVGDTGDNYHTRANVKLYRFEEPASLADQSVSVKTVTVSWSDGRRDSEGMIVEPVPNGRVYLVSKEADGGMYQLRGDFRTTGEASTERIADVRGFVTDAATAPDGSRTVLRSGDYGTLLTGLPGSAPRSVRFPPQMQGEAVTFSLDGRFVLIASEGATDLVRIPVASL